MKTTFGLLKVTLKYTYVRDGFIYCQRRVPRDLTDRYPEGRIRVPIGEVDLLTAEKAVVQLNAKYEREWAALRAAPEASPDTLRVHALEQHVGCQCRGHDS